ncbi:2OG-Fe(II) oxygenase [[Mycobacterium] kokjensenii]|uniref:2OG-Fe(II) oxygenase n=1 Tax=[Mycobacterium] kokjensenii TaxID=3064287 RepID=A0ABM9LT35_9MYCO|nr:2OG-Fe(II) oxygenase [Mycolicibacter sp. MU0083]CAJ1504248.1 2OG-Fe(II) oxygenase [Mycolicibacter sp. MU0083]
MPGPDMLVYDNILSPAQCARLARSTSPGCRTTHPSVDDPGLTGIIDTLSAVVDEVENQHYRSGATGISELTLIRYEPGSRQKKHRDNEYEGAIFHGVTTPRTVYACCVYLADPADYEGGELVVAGHPPMRPSLGSGVFVRGDVEHRVKKITGGLRFALKVTVTVPPTVCWRLRARHGDVEWVPGKPLECWTTTV